MPEELYIRQKELSLRRPDHVLIAGCGGIGSWVAIFLSMAGVERLSLFDPDVLEESNLNRLPFSPESVGRDKASILQGFILRIRPRARVFAFRMAATKSTVDNFGPDVLVDATDSIKSQVELSQACLAKKISYVRVGNDGFHIMLTNAVPRWNMNDDTRYTVTPSWVAPPALLAALAVARSMALPDLEFTGELADIGRLSSTNKTRR